jgi:hypothetical protein
MTDEKEEDGLDATERFLGNKARHDAERAAMLDAARKEAAKLGKESFSAEVLSQYFTPSYCFGDAHSKVLDALEGFEWTYYISEPEIMTLEEFGRRLADVFSQAT